MLKDIRKNPIMLTDCYNLSHQQLKCCTDFEVSHLYNRANPMILYGLKETINTILEIQITMEMVDEAEHHAKRLNLPFPRQLWEDVVKKCNGYLPIVIESVPEGTYCPIGTPFAQIRNTVKGYGEIVTWMEGILMMAYFPSACATRAFQMRQYLEEKKNQYGYDDSFMWRFHSFGFRGHRSLEDAYWAGTAWSMFLQGTDDFHIAQHIRGNTMGSISALAHKVTQQYDDEYECFKHTIETTAKNNEKIVAMVIDTYDAWNVINNYILPLTKYAKQLGVHVVWRPDSGDIFEQALAIYKIAKENNLDNISVIIGEGMTFEEAKKSDIYFENNNVPLSFIAYGIGAGFYKDIERDTLGFAMKTAFSNGQPRMKIVKSNPFKQSIPNIVHLYYDDDVNLVVGNGDSEDIGVYDIIYHYIDNNVVFFDKYGNGEYNNFRDIANYALNYYNSQQKNIILSKETQDLIAEFHKKYDK